MSELNAPNVEISAEAENSNNHNEKNESKPKSKQIQLTFNDFNRFKPSAKTSDNQHNNGGPNAEFNRRRSTRVVPKRPVEIEDDEPVRSIPRKKKPALAKPKETNINREAVRERARKLQSIGNPETLLAEKNWSPNVPLQSADFKNQFSIVSRFRSPNLKNLVYAKDVLPVLTFVNKFNTFLPQELWSLSFQDFELGLDLYPDNDKDLPRKLYQDYMSIKELVRCQDKMNLLFLSLLKLALNNTTPTTMDSVREHKAYAKFVGLLRVNAWSWGYPSQWKVEVGTLNTKVFDTDETEPADPKEPEILVPNIIAWPQQYAIENDPLLNQDLEKRGILALAPKDRAILLKSLVQWVLAQSDKIHQEIYRLSHLKRDEPYGVPTYHVSSLLADGEVATKARFMRVCDLVQARLEIKSGRKHVKKQLQNGKRNDLSEKLKIISNIQRDRDIVSVEENDDEPKPPVDLFDEEYKKWCEVLEGEIPDHPLSSPYCDDIFKMRSLEFFIGRVPHVGDFYLPRLHTYQKAEKVKIPTTYTDFKTLKDTLESFSNKEMDALTLFSGNGKLMSTQFKVLYHDSPSMIRDVASQVDISEKSYWYELCHDCATLREFIELLDYKVSVNETAGNEPANKGIMNKNPLPKESKFNASREALRWMKEYLVKLLPFLETYEELYANYDDMEANIRTLRRSQRNRNPQSRDDDEAGDFSGSEPPVANGQERPVEDSASEDYDDLLDEQAHDEAEDDNAEDDETFTLSGYRSTRNAPRTKTRNGGGKVPTEEIASTRESAIKGSSRGKIAGRGRGKGRGRGRGRSSS
ncbi:WHIM1 domain-containing protein LALA0_S13e01310g [Lachancea lanzarotensis]|uniref:LALA0S13e01310g1_1 n=1 Tax=Lachancea lanzarotensis TaxID=1245769 RepID=A0A0C7NA20_9SACH|nr:uncharacterized protein LALA0_S13e01310g [Lachancea lanzarotensis]CEP64711.1 LALA0S13e01310g1_1 [Lachancea lanzarotensis]